MRERREGRSGVCVGECHVREREGVGCVWGRGIEEVQNIVSIIHLKRSIASTTTRNKERRGRKTRRRKDEEEERRGRKTRMRKDEDEDEEE